MGGNALKNTETERKSRDNYLYISGYMIVVQKARYESRDVQ